MNYDDKTTSHSEEVKESNDKHITAIFAIESVLEDPCEKGSEGEHGKPERHIKQDSKPRKFDDKGLCSVHTCRDKSFVYHDTKIIPL